MKVEEVKNQKAVVTELDGQEVVLYQDGGEVKAVGAICTHLGCTVEYNKEADELHCPCHGSVFEVNGNVIEGPARSPLPVIEVKVEGNEIKLA